MTTNQNQQTIETVEEEEIKLSDSEKEKSFNHLEKRQKPEKKVEVQIEEVQENEKKSLCCP